MNCGMWVDNVKIMFVDVARKGEQKLAILVWKTTAGICCIVVANNNN